MNLVSERRGTERLIVLASATIALACIALLAVVGQARAAETVYWNNYSATPETIAFSDITGSGGGTLNLGSSTVSNPEGMAYDSVTNRLFVANEGGAGAGGQITAINLDGSGAAAFTAPGAVIGEPEGLAIDPVGRMIYWVDVEGTGSIGWAKLDGSAGGQLNTSGATVNEPYRGIAVDTIAGKVYWSNGGPAPETISFANSNNTGGGGNLNLSGATPPEGITGLSVDPAGGRLYWLDNSTVDRVAYASLTGGGGADVNLTGAAVNDPYGLSFDPSLGRLYWGNYGNGEERTNAIGFVNLAGGGGGISPTTAPVNGLQDPTILKSPTGTGAPTVARSTKSRSELTCSQGSWGADFAGSFVYQAPRTFAYQWTRNGTPVTGATAATLATTKPGSYGCIVTAANQTGSASQTSAPINVKAAKVKLTTKKKAKVKAGGVATFKIKAVNQGDIKSKKAKVCVKVPNKAKADLKAKPKCKSLGKVKGKGKDSAKLKIKVGGSASGTYKVTFQVKGSAGKAAKAKIIVG
jgi:hypothetical protein